MDYKRVGSTLAEVSQDLSALTRDPITSNILQTNAIHLQIGAVRLMLLGNSNAGKSTLINALLKGIAVPESGNTSSPIPVWFAAGDDPVYRIYQDTEKGPKLIDQPTRDTFIRKYCFNITDILDDKRTRFQEVDWASAEQTSPLLEDTGIALIDTLGIAATDADTVKTLKVIDSGMDLVIFVTNHVQLLKSEVEFLREKVLGMGQREVAYALHPSQLLIVYNDHGAGGTHSQMCSAADKLLEGYDTATIDRFKQNNLLMVNALSARLQRCGAYDYHHFAPEGTPEMLMASLMKQTERDKKSIAERGDVIAEQAASFEQLEQRIRQMAHEQMHSENGIVERRIQHLEDIIREIRAQATAELSSHMGDRASAQKKISDIRSLLSQFQTANQGVDETYDAQRQEMQRAIACTLSASSGAKEAIIGKIYEMEEAPDFITKESMRDFFDSTDLEQEKILEGWMRTVMEKSFLPEASRQFKVTLLEATAQEGNPQFTEKDTVRYQLAAARNLTLHQGIRMKSLYEQLRQKGADNIGLTMLDARTIEQWAADMASAMEGAILNAIANLQENAYRKLNERMPGIVKTIVGKGILKAMRSWWMQLVGNTKKFWLGVRNSAMKDAAETICAEWFGANLNNAGNDMFFGIDRAYARVQKNVYLSLAEQSKQVEKYLDDLDKILQTSSGDVEEASRKLEKLEASLVVLEEKLNGLRADIGQAG